MVAMKRVGYSRLQIALHWISAAVILWALLSGFFVSVIKVAPETKSIVGFINVSVTALFIPVFILRLYISVRGSHTSREVARPFMECLASWMHKSIYLMTAVVLLTGILMMDRPINIFDLVLIPAPLNDLQWIDRFFVIHVWACVMLLVQVALHIAAVIKHEMCGRRILKKMVF